MPAADMTTWSPHIVERFKTLLNVKEASDETDDEGLTGDDDETKLMRVAIARNRHPQDVRAAHEALTALAFSGYQDWCEYDDDDWTKNCLGQVIDDEQSGFLVSVLEGAGLIDLTSAVEMIAGPYRAAWQYAADNEAAQLILADNPVTGAGLVPAENSESWKYSRTPGTRYYIFRDGQYLYSDDKDAPLDGWATAGARDDQAATQATEWESGSGVFYAAYDNPAHVAGVTHVFGQSKDGPWVLTRSEAEGLLAVARQSPAQGASGAGHPIEPYHDTGHFTKYDNGTYFFGATADTETWYATYQELLDAIAVRAVSAATAAMTDAPLTDALIEVIIEIRDTQPEFFEKYNDEELMSAAIDAASNVLSKQ